MKWVLKICPDCGGRMERCSIDKLVEIDDEKVVIEGVVADVCTQCGAEYIPADSALEFEAIQEKLKTRFQKLKTLMKENVYSIEKSALASGG